MTVDTVQQQVSEVAEALCQRTEELAIGLARAITREVEPYQSGAVPFDMVVDACAVNIRAIFDAIAANHEFDPEPATALGAAGARDGLPLASVMEAYRVAFRELWEATGAEAGIRAHLDGGALRILTAKIIAAQDAYTSAMAFGYREKQTSLLLSEESERSNLIDSLLHGRIFDQSSMWEAADCLRLPSAGPFVVIAVEVPSDGIEALPGVESKLRSAGIYSAWRPLIDLSVGIVHVKTNKQFDDVLDLLSRMATTRVGVSTRFNDLRHAAQALRYARVMLRDRSQQRSLIAVFDGSILATAALSAPEVMVELVTPTMDCFADMSDDAREILLETFRVWMETDGALDTAAKTLFCHPNTVRYRLRRIEQYTGRSLSRPRDLAELSLAFEVSRRLM